MDHCVSSVLNFIIENNHSLIYNMIADQHNMFKIRPQKEVPQMVDLGASPSLACCILLQASLATQASPKHFVTSVAYDY